MRSCPSLPPSVRARRTSPKRLAIRNIRSGFMPGGVPRGRLDSGPGQRWVRLSSHVPVVVFCGLDWGTAALIPAGHLIYAPNLLNTLVCDQVIRPVIWRHSKVLRVLQQHNKLCAAACDGALSTSTALQCALSLPTGSFALNGATTRGGIARSRVATRALLTKRSVRSRKV